MTTCCYRYKKGGYWYKKGGYWYKKGGYWYKKGGYNRHSNIMYHFINDNGLNVTDISSKQDVNYTYFCDATATYTWIDHYLSTSHDITFDCKILPRHADNVSDHLPIRLQTSVLCNRSQSVEHTVNTQCP